MVKKISELGSLTAPAVGDFVEILDISDTTGSATGTNKKITYDDLVLSSAQTLTNKTFSGAEMSGVLEFNNNNITELKTAGFNSELDNGTKTASHTIDFSDAQKQKVTLTANTMTITLSAAVVGNYTLKIVNGGLATITWTSSNWSGGTAPTLTSSGTDIISFYYDGTNFYGVATTDFS